MKYPLIRKYTGKYEDYLREDTDKSFGSLIRIN